MPGTLPSKALPSQFPLRTQIDEQRKYAILFAATIPGSTKTALENTRRYSLKQSRRPTASSKRLMSDGRRPPHLKRKLSAIPPESVGRWITKEEKRSARVILTGHLAHVISGQPLRDLTWLAKRLLASSRYRASHAMVRSDLYLNWRCCQTGALGKDIPDDNYHAVNASYCDIFVTSDPGLAYMSDVLTRTKVELYDGSLPLASWLVAICGKS